MKFIFQDLKFLDNQSALEFSKSYWDFRNEGKESELKTEIEIYHEGNCDVDPKELCPVGSVEWTCSWYEKVWGKKPRPRNIPPELYKFFPGTICKAPAGSNKFLLSENILSSGNGKWINYEQGDWMIKSAETIKSSLNGRYTGLEEVGAVLDLFLDEELILTNWIQGIESEWRCFIYQGKLIDAKCYSWIETPFCTPPDKEIVNKMISAFSTSAPVSYTLDIAVVRRNDGSYLTIPIEVHDFFSCGLYGFDDAQRLPFMLYRWFKEYANNN